MSNRPRFKLKMPIFMYFQFIRILMSKKRKRGCTNDVYVWEHILSLCFSTAWQILKKVGRDEVVMVSYRYKWFMTRSAIGMDPGQGKIGHGGSPSKGLKRTFSSDLKASELTNQTHSSNLKVFRKKCCCFMVPF